MAALPPPLNSRRQRGGRTAGIAAVALGDTIAVVVAVLFQVLIGARGTARPDAPDGFRGPAAAVGRDARFTNHQPRGGHGSKGAEMRSESIQVLLARYRRKLRWLRSKWIFALAVGATASGAYTATGLAAPSSGFSTTIRPRPHEECVRNHAFAA